MVVCTIIAILLAITVPATINARQKAHQTSCMNNLRQIGLGMQMYVQDDGGPPPRLHLLYPQFVSDKRIFVCPIDRWADQGGFTWLSQGRGNRLPSDEPWPIPVSYFYYDFSYPKNAEEMELLTKDAYRPGYAMCLLHGAETPMGPGSMPKMTGLSLRLCFDGSVIERQVTDVQWNDMLRQ